MVDFIPIFGPAGFDARSVLRQAPHDVSDVLEAFLAALTAHGITPLEPIGSKLLAQSLVRFRAEGDKPGKQNAWARLQLEPVPFGGFGSWRTGASGKWKSRQAHLATTLERQRLERRLDWMRHQAFAERDHQQKVTALHAQHRWSLASDPVDQHPYVQKKMMMTDGLRRRGNDLLAPMQDADGKIWNLQRILPDGQKRFLKGGRIKGTFWMPREPEFVVAIGEGVATMAAVRAATGYPVAAALSADNLLSVSRAIRNKWQRADLILCADDDAGSARNKGMEAARTAALVVGGRLAIPPRIDRHG